MNEGKWMKNFGHARWLQRAGVLLFLLGLLNGFIVHQQPLPRVALEAHVIALMSGIFLFALGLAWPRLRFGSALSRIGLALAVYGFYAGWMIYLVAGISGIGGMFPLAAAGLRGAALHERMVSLALASAALAMIALCVLLFWGLRGRAPAADG